MLVRLLRRSLIQDYEHQDFVSGRVVPVQWHFSSECSVDDSSSVWCLFPVGIPLEERLLRAHHRRLDSNFHWHIVRLKNRGRCSLHELRRTPDDQVTNHG